jgi:hypothetical protein
VVDFLLFYEDGRRFFDANYVDICDAVAEMHAMGEIPDLCNGRDLRSALAVAAFVHVAEKIGVEL